VVTNDDQLGFSVRSRVFVPTFVESSVGYDRARDRQVVGSGVDIGVQLVPVEVRMTRDQEVPVADLEAVRVGDVLEPQHAVPRCREAFERRRDEGEDSVVKRTGDDLTATYYTDIVHI